MKFVILLTEIVTPLSIPIPAYKSPVKLEFSLSFSFSSSLISDFWISFSL